MIVLTLALVISLAACGEKSGGDSPAKSSAPAEASSTLSDGAEKEEVKVYGIGETAEANGLAITIDKVAVPDPDIFYNKAKDGFSYMQVYYTFKNVSQETIKTPRNKAIYIVYEEGPTGDDCDMKAEDDSDILPGKKEGMYRLSTELAPGESTNGWMIYQRPVDMKEVTMHYYSKFINVPPDLVFRFAAE